MFPARKSHRYTVRTLSLNTGRLPARTGELEILNTLQYLHRDWPGSFQLGILLLVKKELILKNWMVEQPRNQVSEKHFDEFPNPWTFQCWNTSFKTEGCSCCNFPTEAMLWIRDVEMAESVDDLKMSQSVGGCRFPNFMIYEYFRVTHAHEAVLNNTDQFRISSHGDDIQGFDTRWDQALLSTGEVPKDSFLESVYKTRIRESDQLKTVLAMHEQGVNQRQPKPSHQKMKTMGK